MSGKIPFYAEKARAWNERWQRLYGPHHVRFEAWDKSQCSDEPNPLYPPNVVVLELERFLNGGQLAPRRAP